jgi:hypothetical protein
MNNVITLRTQVDQLRIESSIKRERCTKTIEEMKSYVLQHQENDYLVKGFKKKDVNPYKSKDLKCDVI